MQQEIIFTNPLTAGATGLRVFFVPTRTSISGGGVRGLHPGATSVMVTATDLVMDVRWVPELPSQTPIAVSVQAVGEPLVVSNVQWWNDQGMLVRLRGARAAAGAAVEVVPAEENAAVAFHSHVERCCRTRSEIVRTHLNEPARRHGAFFLDLDLQTHKYLIPCAPDVPVNEGRYRVSIIQPMEWCLVTRLAERRRHAGSNPDTLPERLSTSPRSEVEYISQVLLKVYLRHLCRGGSALVDDDVWEAFGMFANGELRVPAPAIDCWNGEPNSAHLFSFAEFALMAIEHGIHEEIWRQLLPSHVAMQEIFLSAYSVPVGTPRRFESYSPCNWAKDKQVSQERKNQVRERFSSLSTDDLARAAGRHLVEAFADQDG